MDIQLLPNEILPPVGGNKSDILRAGESTGTYCDGIDHFDMLVLPGGNE